MSEVSIAQPPTTRRRPKCGATITCTNMAALGCRGMCKKHYDAWRETNPPVDATLVAAHIAHLRANGFGWRRIAELSCTGRTTVWEIGTGARRTVNADTARAILAVHAATAQRARLDPTGAIRRVRALLAMGHTEKFVADQIGVKQGNLWKYSQGSASWVTPDTHARIDRAFRSLEARPQPTGRFADRARARAAARGWAVPLRWDPDTIDNPDAQPAPLWQPIRPGKGYRLDHGEFIDRYLDARDHAGLDDEQIADQFGITYEALTVRLRRAGMPIQNAKAVA